MSGGSEEYVMAVMLDENGVPYSGRNNVSNSGFKGTYGCPTCTSDSPEVDSGITENTTGVEFPTDTRYFDTYSYTVSSSKFIGRILGDATGEMGPFCRLEEPDGIFREKSYWYNDKARFIYSVVPWFFRDNAPTQGISAGIFAFEYSSGQKAGSKTFRVVLTPQE